MKDRESNQRGLNHRSNRQERRINILAIRGVFRIGRSRGTSCMATKSTLSREFLFLMRQTIMSSLFGFRQSALGYATGLYEAGNAR
jgi:hypothetical protein